MLHPRHRSAPEEIDRVLRPGGTFHFVEHGRAPDVGVTRRQDRFTPLQRRVFGGCHLDRPIDECVGLALTLDRLTSYLPGPRMFGFTYEGVAVKR